MSVFGISVQVAPFDFPGAFSPWDVFPSVVCAPLLEEQGSSNNDASILDLNFHIFSFFGCIIFPQCESHWRFAVGTFLQPSS